MMPSVHRWTFFFLLLVLLIGLAAGVYAADSTIYHQNLSGQPVDLKQWRHAHQDRCWDLNDRQTASTHLKTLQAVIEYLSQDTQYMPYLLSQARKASVLICLENRADGSRGYYDYRFNILAVREKLPFMQKVAIVLHELRHVDHVQRGYRQTLNYAMDEMVRMTFAVEAEVQSFSVRVAWHLKNKGHKALWDTLTGFEKYADIAQKFEAELKAGNSIKQASLSAFEQWYQSEWRRDSYYQGCCMGYLDMLDETKRVESYKQLPEDFFDQLCRLPDGSSYGCETSSVIRKRY